jgi:Domain of unknown function (DUF4365)
MPKRPRSHVLEDLMRSHLHRLFGEAGWAVEDIKKDYGEDLLVRVFENGDLTPFKFFVQAKATDNLTRYLNSAGDSIHFPLRKDHVQHWRSLNDLVILVVWDSRSGKTYWTDIPNHFEDKANPIEGQRFRFGACLPCEQLLDADGLNRIDKLARAFHHRLAQQQLGAEALMRFIEAETGIKVEYPPAGRVILFKRPEGNADVVLLGEFGERFVRNAEEIGVSPEEAMIQAIYSLGSTVAEYEKTGLYPVENSKTGKIEKRKMTIDQLRRHVLRELREDDF